MSECPWTSIEKDDGGRDLSGFSCGLESVDEWIHQQPRPHKGLIAIHLCLGEDDDVMSFFALKHISVSTETLPDENKKLKRGASRDGRSVGLLLAQMGVRADLQGSGIGRATIRESMRKAVRIQEISPFQLFVVDAANEELVDFYRTFGFTRIGTTLRLATPMKAVCKVVDRLGAQGD